MLKMISRRATPVNQPPSKRNVEEKELKCLHCGIRRSDGKEKCFHCGFVHPRTEDFEFGLQFARLEGVADLEENVFDSEVKERDKLYDGALKAMLADGSKTTDYSDGKKVEVRHRRENGDVEIHYEVERVAHSRTWNAPWYSIFSDFKRAAELGHADAEYRLGELYLQGKGCDPNPLIAFALMCRAAIRGSDLAMKRLRLGCHVIGTASYWKPKDGNDSDVIRCLESASEHGMKWATYCLGMLHFWGCGYEKNQEMGIELLKIAAVDDLAPRHGGENAPLTGGFDKAKRMLALCHFDGVGSPLDLDAALRYVHAIDDDQREVHYWTLVEMAKRMDIWRHPERVAKNAELEDYDIICPYYPTFGNTDVATNYDEDQLKSLMAEAAKEYVASSGKSFVSLITEADLKKLIKINDGHVRGWLFSAPIGVGWPFMGKPSKCVLTFTREGIMVIGMNKKLKN